MLTFHCRFPLPMSAVPPTLSLSLSLSLSPLSYMHAGLRGQVLAHLQNDCGKVVQLCTTCNKVVHKEELAKHWEENKECGAAAASKSDATAAGYVMHLICRSLLQHK